MTDDQQVSKTLETLKSCIEGFLSAPQHASEEEMKNVLKTVSTLSESIQKIERSLRESPEVKKIEAKTESDELDWKYKTLELEYADLCDKVRGMFGNDEYFQKGVRTVDYYSSLPAGCVDATDYFKRLAQFDGKNVVVNPSEYERYMWTVKSARLHFVMHNRPFDAKGFHAELHPLLDRITEIRIQLNELNMKFPEIKSAAR